MSEYQPMNTAPRDGTRIKMRVVYEFTARWGEDQYNDDGDPCGGWTAAEGDVPPCWTDGTCWASNEDDVPSAAPDGWAPLPTQGPAS